MISDCKRQLIQTVHVGTVIKEDVMKKHYFNTYHVKKTY